jgi:hypothetical protein
MLKLALLTIIFMERETQEEPAQPQPFHHDTKRGWDNGRYKGPIHKVTFPPPYLAFNEIHGWWELGYHAVVRNADVHSDRTITVYNYIDPAFKERLEANGAKFETEENGEFIPF